MLDESWGRSFEDGLAAEGVSPTVSFSAAETAEAISAFLEKRDAKFQGR